MIIRPFLYDVKKTITSKTVLILVAVILMVSLTIIPLSSIRSMGGFGFREAPVLYYRDNGGYHFLAYSTNSYGDEISGVLLNITLSTGFYPTYQRVASQTQVTNSDGLASINFNLSPGNYSVTVEETYSGAHTYVSSYFLSKLPAGSVQLVATATQAISFVTDKANASKRDVQVFYAGPYGTKPLGYKLYYTWFSSFPIPQNLTENQMMFLGNLTDLHQIFYPDFPSGLDRTTVVVFQLFYPNTTRVEGTVIETSYDSLRIPKVPIEVTNVAAGFFSGLLGFFIPLMAIIGSYSSYGKDRLTGVLESVLARPVTRLSLGVSRYLSTMIAFVLAVAASVGVVDLILDSVGGSFLSQSYVSAIIAGLVVEVAAFTGLIFLLSHLFRSTGTLLGISIGLFVVLDFFWSIIIFLLTSLLGGTPGSAVALQATYLSYYANPAQFISLVNVYVLQSSSGLSIPPSAYGITLPAVILDGLLWAIAPFIIFLILAVKRD